VTSRKLRVYRGLCSSVLGPRSLLCHHQICCAAVSVSFPRLNQVLFIRIRFNPRVDPLSSVEPIFYILELFFFRFVAFLFCVICIAQQSVSHAPSTPANTSPSCSRSTASSRQIQVHAAIDAEAYLPSRDMGHPEANYPPAGPV
jgi:hypothetical protein